MTEIQKRLFLMEDAQYKKFQCSLMPTVDPDTVIGVRTPMLRRLGREISGTDVAEAFLNQLPHRYYEENNLHGVLIEQCRDYERTVWLLERFLPWVDNWATCDMIRPQVFEKNRPQLLIPLKGWLDSGETYTIRFGLGMLMRFYLDEAFQTEYLDMAAAVRSEEYYVKMMVAWLFATALAKQYSAALPYVEGHVLEEWTHNKTIQKAIESRRLSGEQKEHLRKLKTPQTGRRKP